MCCIVDISTHTHAKRTKLNNIPKEKNWKIGAIQYLLKSLQLSATDAHRKIFKAKNCKHGNSGYKSQALVDKFKLVPVNLSQW